MGCAASADGAGRGSLGGSHGGGELPNERELARAAQAVVGPGQEKSIKLFMCGTGGCGKTTFRKQLRSIHGGFSATQRKESAPTIIDNLIQGARALVEFAAKQHPDTVGSASDMSPLARAARRVLKIEEPMTEIPDDLADDLKALWASSEIQDALARRNEFQLEDCVLEFYPEFVKSYPAWGGPDWIPSESDCVRARVRSTGVAEEHFVIEGVTFHIFDAGGQRSERRKWIHYFDKVSAVLFMTSLTGYAEVLFEDANQNSLVESLHLFADIANSKWFRLTPIVLFLNKHDLFMDLFVTRKIPLNVSGKFPDAPETSNPDEAVQWIAEKFRSEKKYDGIDAEPDSLVYVHITTAVDRDVVAKVFYTCKTMVLARAFRDSGFAGL